MKLTRLLANHTMQENVKMKWKDAATIILSCPQQNLRGSTFCDYNVLMLKRSSKSAFYPNNYVFPGGKIDKADCSEKWYDIFSSIDTKFIDGFKQFKINQNDGYRSPLFLPDVQTTKESLSNEVAFRICAIRETFEESGILLSCEKLNKDLNESSHGNTPFKFTSMSDVEFWRNKVHKDAFAFLEMCSSLRCVPDVWSLHEWTNWLTPTAKHMTLTKRYDTVFYKAFIHQLPDYARQDNRETTNLIWNTPVELLRGFESQEVQLGPPQIYELRRCLNFRKFNDLYRFTVDRGRKGMERWLPVVAKTTDDQLMMLYPGDRFYPQEYVNKGESDILPLPHSYKEITEMQPPKLNHGLWNTRYSVVSNFTPPYGHVPAVDCPIDNLKSRL